VCYEATDDVQSAIEREKQIKGWLRRKKVALIESVNPEWSDLGDCL
jgi:putative endonuclease